MSMKMSIVSVGAYTLSVAELVRIKAAMPDVRKAAGAIMGVTATFLKEATGMKLEGVKNKRKSFGIAADIIRKVWVDEVRGNGKSAEANDKANALDANLRRAKSTYIAKTWPDNSKPDSEKVRAGNVLKSALKGYAKAYGLEVPEKIPGDLLADVVAALREALG